MANSPMGFLLKPPILIALIIVIAVLFGGGLYLYMKSADITLPGQAQKAGSEAEVQDLVEKVGKLYDLPTGEVPTIATVSDVSKLEQQEFFTKAQNGDKVLIYTQAKKAILYRPAIDKIIEVGPVNVNNEPQVEGESPATQSAQPTGNVTPTAGAAVKISLFNGTKTAGLTRRMETRLNTFDAVETDIVTRENSTGDYAETLIVDLTGRNAAAARSLATFTGGKVGQLPRTETKPAGADILIILGSDFAEASQ